MCTIKEFRCYHECNEKPFKWAWPKVIEFKSPEGEEGPENLRATDAKESRFSEEEGIAKSVRCCGEINVTFGCSF